MGGYRRNTLLLVPCSWSIAPGPLLLVHCSWSIALSATLFYLLSFISYLFSAMRAPRAMCCAAGALCRPEVGSVASEKTCQKSLLCRVSWLCQKNMALSVIVLVRDALPRAKKRLCSQNRVICQKEPVTRRAAGGQRRRWPCRRPDRRAPAWPPSSPYPGPGDPWRPRRR